MEFIKAVKTGSKYDLKYVWNLDKNVTYIYDYIPLRYDDVGNIHFGYLGASLGYSLKFLQFGAGMYQIYEGTSDWKFYSTYFDDPQDSRMIGLGYNRYIWGT